MIELTYKQAEVFEMIRSFIDTEGYAPSRQEIAKKLGVYPNSVQNHVTALIRKGVMTSVQGKQRSTLPVKGVKYVMMEEA